jgi:hypothetical protein
MNYDPVLLEIIVLKSRGDTPVGVPRFSRQKFPKSSIKIRMFMKGTALMVWPEPL